MNEASIFELYKDLELKHNDICKSCIKLCVEKGIALSNPASLWQVGKKYHEADIKILFVGKIARQSDDSGELKDGMFVDATNNANDYITYGWPYWSYTRAIAERIFQDDAWEYIALSNCIKCDNGSVPDTSTYVQKEHCINQLGVLWKEIEVLQPDKIIFYTHWQYDHYIDTYQPYKTCIEKTDRNHTVKIGSRNMPWWDRRFKNGSKQIDVLRVGHPQFKKKEDFVKKIVTWIKQ